MIEIRNAEPEDLEPIWKIYSTAVGLTAARNDEYWLQLIDVGGMIVAEFAGQVTGFGGIDLQANEQIKYVYVLPDQHKLGIGSKILQRLEDIAVEYGLGEILLHASPGAVDFYRRAGYQACNLEVATEHDHDGVVMKKRIPNPSCEALN
jgi:GNAT superfamily N-acetyltransferase